MKIMKKKLSAIIAETTMLSKSLPKTINESIEFQDLETEGVDGDETPIEAHDEPVAEPQRPVEPAPAIHDDLDANGFVNATRKQALKIMAQLADNPESRTYDIAKKIWMLCDKACVEPKEGEAIN